MRCPFPSITLLLIVILLNYFNGLSVERPNEGLISCDVTISLSETILSPLSLNSLLTVSTYHAHIHPLTFRNKENEFLMNFHPSIAVFTSEELAYRILNPSSYCNFQGANWLGFRSWLSVCEPEKVEMVLHAQLATFTLNHTNSTFYLETNSFHGCDLLWNSIAKRDNDWYPFKQALPSYFKKFEHLFTRRRYVEIAVFGDYSVYNKFNGNEQAALNHMVSIVNMANSFFDFLNIELRVVHRTVFKHPYEANIDYTSSASALKTWSKFMKDKYKDTLPFDHATLIFDQKFVTPGDTVIGRAYLHRLCRSALMNENEVFPISFLMESSTVQSSATTLAHELGHFFGMYHDREHDFLECECPMEKCLMEASEAPNCQFWSSCSLAYLERMYKIEADYCLWDPPKQTVVGPHCGNGIVDPGEDCDCGPFGCINHDCCDNNCKFKGNANCAFGPCCDLGNCRISSTDRICRHALRDCDVPEYCDGKNADCRQKDEHAADLKKCADDESSFCYRGRCASRLLDCREIWGDEAQAAPQFCGRENACEWLKCDSYNSDKANMQIWWSSTDSVHCGTSKVKYLDDAKLNHYMGMVSDGSTCGYGKYCLNKKCISKTEFLGCRINEFHTTETCELDNECSKVSDDVKCASSYGLQAHVAYVDNMDDEIIKWVDITSLECSNNKYIMLSDKGEVVNESAGAFRCVRKKLKPIASADCKTNENCVTPRTQDCESILCDPGWGLLAKFEYDSWIELESAACNSGSFRGTYKNGQNFIEKSGTFKCAKQKCAFCQNPCPSCVPQFNVEFTESSKWDECSKFKCGLNTRTVIVSSNTAIENAELECSSVTNNVASWTISSDASLGEIQQFQCEYSCELRQPLLSNCEAADIYCENWMPTDEKPNECTKHKYILTDSKKLVEISDLRCDKNDGFWKFIGKENGLTEIVSIGSTPYCNHGCDIDPFYQPNSCDVNDECEKPVLKGNSIMCQDEFGLEVDFDYNQNIAGKHRVSSVSCVEHRFEILDKDNNRLHAFPHYFRCIRKRIDRFFSSKECDSDKDCKEPRNCHALECDPQWIVEARDSHVWKPVKSVRCDSNQFEGIFEDGSLINTPAIQVRCVRLKCTQCQNPCSPCPPNSEFILSTKWNECSRFDCGPNTRTVIGSNKFDLVKLECSKVEESGSSWWKVENVPTEVETTADIVCQKLCTLVTPITSSCDPADKFCTEIRIDETIAGCSTKMYYKSEQEQSFIEISKISCDVLSGKWIAEHREPREEHIIHSGSNVHCHEGCNIDSYFNPELCESDNECVKPQMSPSHCPSGYGLQVDFGTQEPSGWNDIFSISCIGNRLKVYKKDNSEMFAFPYGIRCIRKKIDSFFNALDCETNEDCRKPVNCSRIQCDPQWTLQMKTLNWKEVSLARCDSDKFFIDQEKVQENINGVRCVRLRCTFCGNPCPHCANSSYVFIPSSKWNDCAEFRCDSGAETIFDGPSGNSTRMIVTQLECLKIENENPVWVGDGISFETKKDGVSCVHTEEIRNAGVYVGISLGLLVLIIVIVIIALRLFGKGWIHIIILNAITNKLNKNKKEKQQNNLPKMNSSSKELPQANSK